MLGVLIRREILAHVLSLRFAVTFALFIVLIFASIFVTVSAHRQDREEFEARGRANRDHLTDILGEKDEERLWDRLFWDEGVDHAVPPVPLAWLGQGLSLAWPATLNTTSDGARSVDPGLTRNPLLGLLRVPDFVYIVNAVLSLLAILFMFDAVCGEKESGTLRLVLSNAVPRHEILLSKWIAGYAVLMIPFTIAVAGGLGYAWVRGAWEPTADVLARVLALVAVAAFYVAAFFNISLFVSTTAFRPATALLVCLLVWVASIIVLPNLGPVTARILRPTPSRKSIDTAKRVVDQEIDLKIQRLTLTSGELSYGSSVSRSKEKLDQERGERKRELDAYYQARLDEQLDLARTLGRLSPAACWTYAAVALTGTGPAAYDRFRRARETLSTQFTTYVDDMVRKADRTQWRERPKVVPEEIPTLHLSFPSTAEAFGSALDDLLILLIVGVAFFMLAFVFFLRYDAR
jgi:ABC-type transport system involved in multi-copper enzyme maturation permease subunit